MSGVPSDKVTSGSFVNPKVGASCDPVDSWYRHYAGYSAGFVEQALKEFAESAKLVLDPWNGTGSHAAGSELDDDPLLFLFSPRTVGSIRGLQQSV